MPRKAEDLTGRQFGSRKVLRRAASRDYAGNKTIYWVCACIKCGYRSDVQGSSLKRGAGCPACIKGPVAPASPNQTAQKAVPQTKNPKSKKSQPAMTVGQLRAALAELPDNTAVRVNLVGKKGWATVSVRDVTSTRGMVLLVSNLPTRIEPWRND